MPRKKKLQNPLPPLSKDQFKALQSEWYAKLKDEGFKDIEWGDTLREFQDTNPDRFKGKRSIVEATAIETYYRMAGQFFHSHKFKDLTQKYIWGRHSDGTSVRDIVLELRAKGKKASYRSVYTIVRSLAVTMREVAREEAHDDDR